MKIAIDARFLGPEGTGIGKYTEKLLENLQILDSENEYKVLLRRNNFDLFKPKSKNFEKVLVSARWYGVKEQLLMPFILLKINPELVHFPHFNIPLLYPGKFVVTIHDIINSEYKGSSSTTRSLPIYYLKRVGYELSIRQAVNRSKKIFVPSEFIKTKLIETFDSSDSKIKVTYESADDVFLKSSSALEEKRKRILKSFGLEKPFLLYVGAAYKHKNLENLFQSLNLITKKISLVIVSKKDIFTDRLLKKAKKAGVEDRLVVTGFVPNEDLAVLYKQAECLVFPSLSEGFGLPGIEAFASGCPVVCSDIPVLREIYADAAYYFDPKDPKNIASKLELIIKNSKLKIELREKGLEQVKKYSWRKMAQETLSVYRAVLSNS